MRQPKLVLQITRRLIVKLYITSGPIQTLAQMTFTVCFEPSREISSQEVLAITANARLAQATKVFLNPWTDLNNHVSVKMSSLNKETISSTPTRLRTKTKKPMEKWKKRSTTSERLVSKPNKRTWLLRDRFYDIYEQQT
jgi:hypothetical protein